MFGGTDDTSELNDFWMFDVKENEWSEIECMNGPSPRSGCKMVFDPVGNQLFILGKKSPRGSDNQKVRSMNPSKLLDSKIIFPERLLSL